MKNNIAYHPPKEIWEVYKNININDPLKPNDPRYVHTEKARGKFSFSSLCRLLLVDYKNEVFYSEQPTIKNYSIFCGHRGCGKSTELKRLANKLDKDNLFLVVFVETAMELDTHNIQVVDICMTIAKKLFERLNELNIEIDQGYSQALENWFFEKIITNENEKETRAELSSGIEVGAKVPFLLNVFTKLTTSFKNNVSNKTEFRNRIINNFSDFAAAFNNLLDAVRDKLYTVNRKGLLFIVDDIEKISLSEARKILIENVNQLKQINSNFIYTAPINMTYFDAQLPTHYNLQMFPMIKIYEKDGSKNEEGFKVMREILLKRADISLFESEEVIEKIIQYSGGNSSHLLRILEIAYSVAENNIFDEKSIDIAIKNLANQFSRFLTVEHYKLLNKIDNTEDKDISEDIRFLLYNLAMLEYNEYWWKSHPVVRTLDEYKKYS